MTDPAPEPTPDDPTPADIMRAFGYDPERVKSLVITPTTVVAIDADYPDLDDQEDTTDADD